MVTVIMPQTMEIYERYRKVQVEEGEKFTLNEVIDFVSTFEMTTPSCAWTSAKNLPKEMSLLQFPAT